jgi:diguanylate cyclase (GGDEF)-like protein
MIEVVACVFDQHNLAIVLLAAVICACACAGAFFVLSNAAAMPETARSRWLFLAAVLAGGGTWATHFVAMLGYNPGISLSFDALETAGSALIAIGGALCAFTLFQRFAGSKVTIAAGVLLGGAIAAMHYVGASGIEGAREVWALNWVGASVLFAMSLSIAALHAFRLLTSWVRVATSAGLLGSAIVSLHFAGMHALTLVPDPTFAPVNITLDPSLLAVTVAIAALGVLILGVVLALSDRRVAAVELEAARQSASMALHDALTGLPNRRFLVEDLQQRLAAGARFAMIALDLDRFKPVNDLYGHAAGDALLVHIGALLQDEAGEDGLAVRLGSDEFVLILSHHSDDELIRRLNLLVGRFAEPLPAGDGEVVVGASLGVALAPAEGADAAALIRRADIALYRAKADGRARFAFFEPGMDALAEQRAALERDLRTAVRRGDIVPYYQPLVRLKEGSVSGYEILARWPRADGGFTAPDQFIPLAEEAGVIGELTLHLLRSACLETLDWRGAPMLSLNISPVQLRDPLLAQRLLQVLTECGFPAARLEIEVTENALVANYEEARTMLISLKNLGVHVALDDFGTGYSSLRHLRELPFDVLKIDRSFIADMMKSSEARAIVKTIIDLAKNLGLDVTAEGVESELLARELRDMGCNLGQGFLFGHAAPGSRAAAPADAAVA